MKHSISRLCKFTGLGVVTALGVITSSALTSPANAAEPPMVTLQQLDFGDFIPIAGQCDMPHDTGIFVVNPSLVCTSPTGRPGHYRINATQNTVVSITVYTYTDPMNPITYKPTGIVQSSVETKALINDITSNINSGSSGRIDVYLGGLVTFSASNPAGMSFDTMLTMDIAE